MSERRHGISRNFLVFRLLVWSWEMLLNDMVLKINVLLSINRSCLFNSLQCYFMNCAMHFTGDCSSKQIKTSMLPILRLLKAAFMKMLCIGQTKPSGRICLIVQKSETFFILYLICNICLIFCCSKQAPLCFDKQTRTNILLNVVKRSGAQGLSIIDGG